MDAVYWKMMAIWSCVPRELVIGLLIRGDTALTIVALAALYLGLVYWLLGVLQGQFRQSSGETALGESSLGKERRSPLRAIEDEAA